MLSTSLYNIFYKDTHGSEEVYRPLGLNSENQVVILPKEAEAPRWKLLTGDTTAAFFINGQGIVPRGEHNIGTNGSPAFIWHLKKFDDMEGDVYAIQAHFPNSIMRTWHAPPSPSGHEALIELGYTDYPFHFQHA